jgi:dihydrofolate synthase / folylpolyglutamate synthase
MQVTAYKTPIVTAGSHDLFELIDAARPTLGERSIVVVTSKIVALCERRVVPMEGADKDELIRRHASKFLPKSFNRYNVSFTVVRDMLVPMAGIDESNGNGNFVLWPEDPQASANAIRKHLSERFGLKEVGVIVTDSALRPLRWGVTGIGIASSGFVAVEDDIGKPDLFGRPLQFTKTHVQDGLAAAAALVMGEGAHQTPLAAITDVPFVTFTGRDPTAEELAAQRIDIRDDLYAPFLEQAPWQDGEGV